MTDAMGALRAAQPMPRGERLATWWESRNGTYEPARMLWFRRRNHSGIPHAFNAVCPDGIIARVGGASAVRTHAAPLALARERRRRERAEAFATLAKAHAAELIAALLTMDAALVRLRADVIEYEAQMHAARGEATEHLAQARHWREQAKAAEQERDALRAGHTCREGDRVDCPACDTYMRGAYLPPPPTREEVDAAVDELFRAEKAWRESTGLGRDDEWVDDDAARCRAARDALVALATRGRT